jgi:hypothetical protein
MFANITWRIQRVGTAAVSAAETAANLAVKDRTPHLPSANPQSSAPEQVCPEQSYGIARCTVADSAAEIVSSNLWPKQGAETPRLLRAGL